MTKKQRFIFNALYSAIFTLAFCAAPNISPLHAAKKTRPHKLHSSRIHRLHKTNTANSASSTKREAIDSGDSYLIAEGKASYYARNFRGKKTASGESFNLRNFTAAHRSLPFGTSVKVINLDNGKNVVVRINDRGPHLKGRIIDVSPAAAKEIGLFGNGTANVRIEAFD
jgi:rare lipoprotein A